MRGHHHPAECSLGSHRDLGAVVEAALHLTFGTLLELIGRQVQPRLNQRVIEQVIVFAAVTNANEATSERTAPLPYCPSSRSSVRSCES